MNSGSYHIEGLDDIEKALSNLPAKLGEKILFRTNRTILTKIIKRPLQSAIPYSLKTKKSVRLATAWGLELKTGALVGVSSDGFFLRFLTFGTRERKTRKGLNRGSIRPRDTGIIRTIDQKTGAVLEEVNKEYGEYVYKILTRDLKKYQL